MKHLIILLLLSLPMTALAQFESFFTAQPLPLNQTDQEFVSAIQTSTSTKRFDKRRIIESNEPIKTFTPAAYEVKVDNNYRIKTEEPVHYPNYYPIYRPYYPNSLVPFAKQFIGVRYKWGGTTTKGFDCSGFVQYVYKQTFGIEIPRNSRKQYKYLDKVSWGNPGDLVFFAKRKRISHVGMMIDNENFIHSSSSKGVTISSLNNKYYQKKLRAFTRV